MLATVPHCANMFSHTAMGIGPVCPRKGVQWKKTTCMHVYVDEGAFTSTTGQDEDHEPLEISWAKFLLTVMNPKLWTQCCHWYSQAWCRLSKSCLHTLQQDKSSSTTVTPFQLSLRIDFTTANASFEIASAELQTVHAGHEQHR
jgi:hypothetical protein